MTDITTIHIDRLKKDLQESNDDIIVCEKALLGGVQSYSGGSVKERLKSNKYFVKVISIELDRRNMKSNEL